MDLYDSKTIWSNVLVKCNNFHTRQSYNYNTSKSELTQHNGHVTSSMQCTALVRYLGSVSFWFGAQTCTSCSQVQLLDLLNFLIIKPTFLNQIVWNFPQKSYYKSDVIFSPTPPPSVILRHLSQTPSSLRWWRHLWTLPIRICFKTIFSMSITFNWLERYRIDHFVFMGYFIIH